MARKKLPLTSTDMEKIERMAALGMTVGDMAIIMGMSKATLDRRMKDTQDAIESLERGRVRASFTVKSRFYSMASSGKNTAATIFWLKVRENWKETTIVQHGTEPGGALEKFLRMDPADRQKRLAWLEARLGRRPKAEPKPKAPPAEPTTEAPEPEKPKDDPTQV